MRVPSRVHIGCSFVFVAALAGIACARNSLAATVSVNVSPPAIDKWNYPFASNSGGGSYAAVFGAYTPGSGFHPDFDNRDSQVAIRFNTAQAGIPTGRGQWSYTIQSARVSLTVESNFTFTYDPTPDSYRIWLPKDDPQYQPDADAGHAVELFGTQFRNGLTAGNFTENTPFSPLGQYGKGVRSAFAFCFFNGMGVDVSNNVDARFDPVPFAVGLTSTLNPGDSVPANTVLQFQLDLSSADVNRYLQRGLNAGILDFSVASIFPASQQQTGTYPRFYTKENLAVIAGVVSAARLELTADVNDSQWPAGDVNGDGLVNVNDLLAVINGWGSCPSCAADVTNDGNVNVNDLLAVINSWGS